MSSHAQARQLSVAGYYSELNVDVVYCSSVYRVRYLDLSMAVVSVDTLEELLSSCVYLLRLSLESCQLSNNICRSAVSDSTILILHTRRQVAK